MEPGDEVVTTPFTYFATVEGIVLDELTRQGWTVGTVEKATLGLEKIDPERRESMCNPVSQAMLLNEAGCELNVVLGLCVGHDMLFSKYAKAPTSTIVVKDRVTGHNPVSVLYGQNFYYKRLQAVPVAVPED